MSVEPDTITFATSWHCAPRIVEVALCVVVGLAWGSGCSDFNSQGLAMESSDWKDPREHDSTTSELEMTATQDDLNSDDLGLSDSSVTTFTSLSSASSGAESSEIQDDSTTDDSTQSSSTQSSSTSSSPEKLQLGDLCLDDASCRSAHCVGDGVSGAKRCGECAQDFECQDSTCRVHPEGGSTCEPAQAGNECLRDSDCGLGLICDDTTAIHTCQVCRTDAQCADHHYCARHWLNHRFERSCRPYNSALLGDQCLEVAQGSAERSCVQPICAQVEVEDNVLYVCSECQNDEQCATNQLCEVTSNVNPNFAWPMRTCVTLPTAR